MAGSRRAARALARLGWPHLVKPFTPDLLIGEIRTLQRDLERTLRMGRRLRLDRRLAALGLREAVSAARESARRNPSL